ncbi:hypothetical protein LTR05_000213 [Lithohypha guttulata]|uniref:Uncharacterized protein n=1 Tax=Lithohypha guttulata TaxID=1690604 RepID=A0AAN7TB19_9EURO|nr:hypothetical protein LTR05_000213 [Lithohypha guttulata]
MNPPPSAGEQVHNLVGAMNSKTADGNMFIIQHDTTSNSVAVTRAILRNLKPGWKAVPLVECLGYSLDNAFQFPGLVKYEASNVISHGGCLVSGPGTCLGPIRFADRDGCHKAVSAHRGAIADCHRAADKLTTQPRAHCLFAEKMVNHLERFCKDCGNDKGKAKTCDSRNIVHKDPHPEILSELTPSHDRMISGASRVAMPLSPWTVAMSLWRQVFGTY